MGVNLKKKNDMRINTPLKFKVVFRNALGIGAASFWSVAEKDIAESPTAEPERPKAIHNS